MKRTPAESRRDFVTAFARAVEIITSERFTVGTEARPQETPSEIIRYRAGGTTHIWIWDYITVRLKREGFFGTRQTTVHQPAVVGILYLAKGHSKEVLDTWTLRIYSAGDYRRRFETLRNRLQKEFGVVVEIDTQELPIPIMHGI